MSNALTEEYCVYRSLEVSIGRYILAASAFGFHACNKDCDVNDKSAIIARKCLYIKSKDDFPYLKIFI